jgi:hypothetical protein
VRNEKIVANAADSYETQRKRTIAVGSRYQSTASEDFEYFICAVVTVVFGVFQ